MAHFEDDLEEEFFAVEVSLASPYSIKNLFCVLVLVSYFCLILNASPQLLIDFAPAGTWDTLAVCLYGLVLIGSLLKNYRKGLSWKVFFQWPDVYCFILMVLTLKVTTLSAIILGLRLSFMLAIYSARYVIGRMLLTYVRHHPSLTLIASFGIMILVGTSLLLLPQATVDGQGASFMTALFTMTSAICVTGLTVVDTGSYFSLFGHVVLLMGFQTGALAIMILSSLIALFVGGLLRSSRRGSLGRILDVTDSDSLRRFIAAVCFLTFGIELLGAGFVFFSWKHTFLSFQDAAWWSVFHAVSAFCNAGFALNADSLGAWSSNGGLVFGAGSLIIFGGLGFAILVDVVDQGVRWWRQPQSWWAHLHIQKPALF